MRAAIDLVDSEGLELFHGTSQSSAEKLCKDGWSPSSYPSGSQCGSPRYLYLTNHPDNAKWYADQKENGCVIQVLVPRSLLRVDPDDGTYDSVDEEISGSVPGSLVLTGDLCSSSFAFVDLNPSKKKLFQPK